MLNHSDTMPEKPFTLSLPESVARAFNLHEGKHQSNQYGSHQPNAQERLAVICSVACDVIRYYTPQLTEPQWDIILSTVQTTSCWDWADELRQVADPLSNSIGGYDL